MSDIYPQKSVSGLGTNRHYCNGNTVPQYAHPTSAHRRSDTLATDSPGKCSRRTRHNLGKVKAPAVDECIISTSVNDITRVLERIQKGEPSAAEALLPLVYEELRALAAQKMAQEQPGQTLQATALVHEHLRVLQRQAARFTLAACQATRGPYGGACSQSCASLAAPRRRMRARARPNPSRPRWSPPGKRRVSPRDG
ncbi:MAG: ECF-type sigma factor [Gemmataceae bacterium]